MEPTKLKEARFRGKSLLNPGWHRSCKVKMGQSTKGTYEKPDFAGKTKRYRWPHLTRSSLAARRTDSDLDSHLVVSWLLQLTPAKGKDSYASIRHYIFHRCADRGGTWFLGPGRIGRGNRQVSLPDLRRTARRFAHLRT